MKQLYGPKVKWNGIAKQTRSKRFHLNLQESQKHLLSKPKGTNDITEILLKDVKHPNPYPKEPLEQEK